MLKLLMVPVYYPFYWVFLYEVFFSLKWCPLSKHLLILKIFMPRIREEIFIEYVQGEKVLLVSYWPTVKY